MRVKKIDIIHRFIPLAWHVFFIIFIAFHITKDGLNLIVDESYSFLIYLNIALCLAFFLIETFLAHKIISKWRITFFLLFIILAVSIPPLMGDWQLFNTFIVIYSGIDLLLIMLNMVKDSIFTEERLANQKLPVNQFTDKRKLVSRIVYLVSFILLFVLSFIIFYYNEVSLEALVILTFVGIIIVSVAEIIKMSISLKPMERFIKKFRNDLSFEDLEKNILALDEPKLHEETRNMMYIELWEYASFVNIDKATTFEGMTFQPKTPENLNRYNEALFWYLLNKGNYELILVREAVFKKLPHKKDLIPYIAAIKGEKKKLKLPKKPNRLDDLKKELYDKILASKEPKMKIAIMYESMTGNTKMLADSISRALGSQVIYNGKPSSEIEADLYFIGSWTDRGNENASKPYDFLKNKKLAIFGSCGYLKGDYENRLADRFASTLDPSNLILGHFYSLGKMKEEARDKFIDIIKANPLDEDLEVTLEDYDLNQTHPDANDLERISAWAKDIIK